MQPTNQPSPTTQPAPAQPQPGADIVPPPSTPAAVPVRPAPPSEELAPQPPAPAEAPAKKGDKKPKTKATGLPVQPKPIRLIVITLLVMAALSGLAIWLYIQSSHTVTFEGVPVR